MAVEVKMADFVILYFVSRMDEVLASATVKTSSAGPAASVPSVPTQNVASQPDVSEASKGVVSAPGRVRRRSTSSRSSRSMRSLKRDMSHSSSPSSDHYYRRSRHRRSRLVHCLLVLFSRGYLALFLHSYLFQFTQPKSNQESLKIESFSSSS